MSNNPPSLVALAGPPIQCERILLYLPHETVELCVVVTVGVVRQFVEQYFADVVYFPKALHVIGAQSQLNSCTLVRIEAEDAYRINPNHTLRIHLTQLPYLELIFFHDCQYAHIST